MTGISGNIWHWLSLLPLLCSFLFSSLFLGWALDLRSGSNVWIQLLDSFSYSSQLFLHNPLISCIESGLQLIFQDVLPEQGNWMDLLIFSHFSLSPFRSQPKVRQQNENQNPGVCRLETEISISCSPWTLASASSHQ